VELVFAFVRAVKLIPTQWRCGNAGKLSVAQARAPEIQSRHRKLGTSF
jgi:hypothetical protein